MNTTEFATLKITELKSFCGDRGIEPVGDKRSKATWVAAIVNFENVQPAIETIETIKTIEMTAIPDPFEVAIETETVIRAAIERFADLREASIVALIIAVLVIGMLRLVVKVGFASLAWAIVILTPLALGLWRYLLPAPTATGKIDYFPLPV